MYASLPIDIAEAILWFHVVVIAFNVFGLVAIPLGAWSGWKFVRVFWWRALHLGLLGIVALQAVLGRACFLTIWESDFLRRAGEAASNEPLIRRWVSQAIYWPLPLWFFAMLYVAVCAFTLLLWWLVPPWSPRPGRSARIGSNSGARRTLMLRGTPGCRRISPARSRVSTNWWTEGADIEVPLKIGFGRRPTEHARNGIWAYPSSTFRPALLAMVSHAVASS